MPNPPTAPRANANLALKSSRVWCPDRGLINDAGIVINNGRISASGRWAEDCLPALEPHMAVHDMGDATLLPGLVNAHTHLDYSSMRFAICRPKSFTGWVQKLNSIKRQLDPTMCLDAIRRGFEEALAFGTTAICTMEAFPELMPHVPTPPMRTWWCYEMIDVRHRNTPEEVVEGALRFFSEWRDSLSQSGLNPHAPYTASAPLFRLAAECGQKLNLLLTTHVAESSEEWDMFDKASGPLHEFLASIGRPMDDCGNRTPFQKWFENHGAQRWLLAHMNQLSPEDLDKLASLPPETRPTVVHCPGSHRYFDHPTFPYAQLRSRGIPVCLGTDSLASTDSLSLFSEMRSASQTLTEDSDELLRMVTITPGDILAPNTGLGTLRPNAPADLIALPIVAKSSRAIVDYEQHVPWVMIAGKILVNLL